MKGWSEMTCLVVRRAAFGQPVSHLSRLLGREGPQGLRDAEAFLRSTRDGRGANRASRIVLTRPGERRCFVP